MQASINFIAKSNRILQKILDRASQIHFLGFKSEPLQAITRVLYLQAAIYFLSYCKEADAPYIRDILEADELTSRRLWYGADSKAVAKLIQERGGHMDYEELAFILDRLIILNKCFVHGNHIYFKVEQALGVLFRNTSKPVKEKDFAHRSFYLKLWARTIFIIRQFQNPITITQVYKSYVAEAMQNGEFVQTREAQRVFA